MCEWKLNNVRIFRMALCKIGKKIERPIIVIKFNKVIHVYIKNVESDFYLW